MTVQPGDPLPRTDAPHAPVDVPAAPAVAKPASIVPEKSKAPSLQPARLKGGEFSRQIYDVDIPAGVSIEQLQAPGYWAHVASRLRKRDRLECLAEDGSFFAELLVRETGRMAAIVSLLRFHELDVVETQGPDLSAFEFKHITALGWIVARKADKSRLSEGHDSETSARLWAASNRDKA